MEENTAHGKLKLRVKNVEHAIQLLTEMALRADERTETNGEPPKTNDDEPPEAN